MDAVVSVLCVGGCALGMFLVAMLLRRERRTRANLLLAGVIGLACFAELFSAAAHLSQVAGGVVLQIPGFQGLLLLVILSYTLASIRLVRSRIQPRPESSAAPAAEADPPAPGAPPPPEKAKYGNNRLPDFARETIVGELQRHMQTAQPWLNVDLTLGELAAGINVSPHHLSQIINSEFGKSFASYINEYRVEEARQLLTGDHDKSVLDVALDSGFSSKSSFNASFKKLTGMTPSEYRKSAQHRNYLVA